MKYGEVQRGTISGITLQPLTTRLAEQLGAPNTHGLVVVSMQQRSDAYVAGLRPGDVIVSFNGTTVEDPSHFQRLLADAKIGGDGHARRASRRTAGFGQGADRQGQRSGQTAIALVPCPFRLPRQRVAADRHAPPLGFHSHRDPDSRGPRDVP